MKITRPIRFIARPASALSRYPFESILRLCCINERLCNALPGPILALRPETGNLGAKRDRLAGQIGPGRGWKSPCSTCLFCRQL